MDNQVQTQTPTTRSPVMHSFTESNSSSPVKSLLLLVLVAFIGIGSGFGLAQLSTKAGKNIPLLSNNNSVTKGKTYGSSDTTAFKDTTEGVLKTGGIDGEGQYHLVRSGGDSQNVYLTSSSVDLAQFVDRKIKIWGETQDGERAGWLMDVGRVEVLD